MKTSNINFANSQPKYAPAISGSNAENDDSSLESRYVSKKVGTHNVHKTNSPNKTEKINTHEPNRGKGGISGGSLASDKEDKPTTSNSQNTRKEKQ